MIAATARISLAFAMTGLAGLAPCQSDRVATRLAPKLGQTVHITTTQSLSLRMMPAGVDAGATSQTPAAAQIVTETLLRYQQTNPREFTVDGRLAAVLTIDTVEMKQILNGTPKTIPDIFSQLHGRTVKALFDRQGKLIDVQVPQEMSSAAAILKQLIGGVYSSMNFFPPNGLTVGETEATPSTIPLRLPGRTAAVPYQTRTRTTLKSIEKSAAGRVAHFTQQIESADTNTEPIQVKGQAIVDINIDRGFIAASTTEWNFTGEGKAVNGGGGVQGTIRITVATQ